MSWTLCTSGAAISKAGLNANSTIIASGATLALWSDESEGVITSMTKYNWIDDYSTLNADVQGILQDCASSHIGMKIINYDMSGYTSRAEATTMLDLLRDNFVRDIELLKTDGVQTFIKAA